jgi:hypothetical protein
MANSPRMSLRRVLPPVIVLALVLGVVVVAPLAAEAPPVARAGVASVDGSWHLGASGGQFSATEAPFSPDRFDPHLHATKKRPADAIASRIVTRALVVDGADGDRVAVVANDLYLPNDLLNRRVADLLTDNDRAVGLGLADGPVTGVGEGNLAVTVSHNHNSPFYSTPGWGTWIFQDVMDLRFYEYYAEQMAEAVIAAVADMRPVRMGAATVPFNEITSHTYGPRVAQDGTPTGQPWSHTTGMMSLLRFDDVTDPDDPQPYALWNTLGVHPEWTWGYDVFNGDITHATMRIVDRELGVTTVMSQRETGSSGPHKDTRVHQPEARREFQDNGFEQLDHGARLWADRLIETYEAIALETPTSPFDPAHPRTDGAPIELVPFSSDFEVDVASMRFAPPTARPVPTVSNCNTAQLFHGNPQAPVLGLPDCSSRPGGVPLRDVGEAVVEATPVDEHGVYEDLKELGVPIPETYSGTSFTGVQETAAVHLMAMRFGDVVATFCPCEQFTDTALNIQSRLDRTEGNVWVGWDWASQTTPSGREWCIEAGDGTSTCADPRNPANDLPPVRTVDVERMLAQVRNDAAGWETDVASAFGEAESADPERIFGNFTHAEATEHGYGMVVAVGMANDYFGYVPNYREMRSWDHYRKALNGLGPHGADFLATRLVALGASLNGGPAVQPSPADLVYQAESARAGGLSRALGEAARTATLAYEQALPADGGTPAVTVQPEDIQRFDAAHVSWVGGSNYTDLPDVVVERLEDGGWVTVGDMHGEVQVMVDFPAPADLPSIAAGRHEWIWTAAFEAFATDLTLPDAQGRPERATPPGTYRFAIDGHHRTGPGDQVEAYALTSEPFAVGVWDGITAEVELAGAGQAVVTVGPTSTLALADGNTYTFGPIDYPHRIADSPFTRIDGDRQRFTYGLADPERHQFYCRFCRFRPWADTADAASVTVTVQRADGTLDRVAAAPTGEPGVWRATVAAGGRRLEPGDRVVVEAGAVVDAFGNRNGAPSAVVTR